MTSHQFTLTLVTASVVGSQRARASEYPDFGAITFDQAMNASEPGGKPPRSVRKERFAKDELARAAASVEYLAEMESQPESRGASDVQLYRTVAPSVVLIVTLDANDDVDSMGSGTVVSSDGLILTNAHVVGSHSWASVFFKPASGDKPDGFYVGLVERIDETADLATLRLVDPPPSQSVATIGPASPLDVGLDVHAVGHPEGEVWTYTKGIVSAYRRDYKWTTGDSLHQATVIQTQTPINPGSSGGGLFNDSGELVGVNSFFMSGAQGMNYAVSAEEVRRFLKSKGNKVARRTAPAPTPSLEISGRDTNGDGREDLWLVDEDGNGTFESALGDSDGDGKIDFGIIDLDDDGRVDIEAYDTDGNEKFDLYGFDYDQDGEVDEYGVDVNEDGTPDRYRRP